MQLLHVLTALPFLSVPVVIAPLGGGWRTRRVRAGFINTRPPPPRAGAGEGALTAATAVISAVSCAICAACVKTCTSFDRFISEINAVVVVLVVAEATVSERLPMVEALSASMDLNSRLSALSAAAYSATAS